MIPLEGEARLRHFLSHIKTPTTVGSTAPMFAETPSGHSVPWFDRHYIRLAPGEIYEAKVSVTSDVHGVVHFRFLVSGHSDTSRFVVHSDPMLAVAGDFLRRTQYAHVYLKGSQWPPWIGLGGRTPAASTLPDIAS